MKRTRTKPTRTMAVAIVAAITLVGTACGSSGESVAEDESTTSTTVTETTESATSTTEAPPSDTDDEELDGSEAEVDGAVETDELAAQDVAAYVAAYQEALTNSQFQLGDGPAQPIDRAEFFESLTVRSGTDSIQFLLGAAGVEEVMATIDDEIWFADDPASLADLSSAIEALDAGDVLEAAITLTSADDPSAEKTMTISLDTDLIGGGDSIVEVVDGYATIRGVLGTETYVQLQDTIEANPEVDTLVMLSVEGSENDAINLHTSRLIRQAGWTTWLPANGDISSGGVDMFLAGAERVIEPGGFLGVHSWGSGDGEVVAADLPEDHPAHRAQLDYVTEMLGAEIGPDFYFYTLRAAPAASIHRMTEQEVETYGLATRSADAAVPSSVTGPPAGYLQLVDQVYLKHQVLSCEIDGDALTAELESEELGRVRLAVDGAQGELIWSELPPGMTDTHSVSDVSVDDGQVTLAADLDFDELIGEDTSGADFAIDCGS